MCVCVCVQIVLSVQGAREEPHLFSSVFRARAAEGGRQGVTTADSDGCATFHKQLGQLDTLTRGTCFPPHTNLLKDNSNGGSRCISKFIALAALWGEGSNSRLLGKQCHLVFRQAPVWWWTIKALRFSFYSIPENAPHLTLNTVFSATYSIRPFMHLFHVFILSPILFLILLWLWELNGQLDITAGKICTRDVQESTCLVRQGWCDSPQANFNDKTEIHYPSDGDMTGKRHMRWTCVIFFFFPEKLG